MEDPVEGVTPVAKVEFESLSVVPGEKSHIKVSLIIYERFRQRKKINLDFCVLIRLEMYSQYFSVVRRVARES